MGIKYLDSNNYEYKYIYGYKNLKVNSEIIKEKYDNADPENKYNALLKMIKNMLEINNKVFINEEQ